MTAPIPLCPSTSAGSRHLLASAQARTAVVVQSSADGDHRATIAHLLRRIRAAAPHAGVVVDAPAGDTADLARATARELGGIEVVEREHTARRGCAAVEWAAGEGYEAIVEIPADLSFDPADIVALLTRLDDAELVIGVRSSGPDGRPLSLRTRLFTVAPSRYAALALGPKIGRDPLSAFRAYELVAAGDPTRERRSTSAMGGLRSALEVEHTGGRIVDVPVAFADRQTARPLPAALRTSRAVGMVTWWAIRARLRARRA